MAEKTAAERVALARHPQRPNITDYIDGLSTNTSIALLSARFFIS